MAKKPAPSNNIPANFSSIQKTVNRRLAKETRKRYPPNLYEPIKYALTLRAKRLRPVLLVFACEAVGGKQEDCMDAALAIEMLHCFTLVHDDIMDGDLFRRGSHTIHHKWDDNVAILAGDALIALAYEALQRVSSPFLQQITQIFSQGIIKVCEGQSLDKDFESIDEVSIRDYLRMIHRKTGTLMSIAAEIGGILGKGDNVQVKALRKYGEGVGIAFQIQDDLLDIIAEEQLLGKDLGSDLSQGKKTYPLLLLLERAGTLDRNFTMKLLNKKKITETDFSKVKALLHKYNIITDIEREVHRRIQSANNVLLKLQAAFQSDNLLSFSQVIEKRVN